MQPLMSSRIRATCNCKFSPIAKSDETFGTAMYWPTWAHVGPYGGTKFLNSVHVLKLFFANAQIRSKEGSTYADKGPNYAGKGFNWFENDKFCEKCMLKNISFLEGFALKFSQINFVVSKK